MDADMRDGFSFFGGHPALDLCATLRGRSKPTPQDLLAAPGDLNRWFRAAGVTSSAVAATQDDLVAARKLREAIYVIALAIIDGETPPPAARATLNRIADSGSVRVKLSADGLVQVSGSAAELIAAVAQGAVRLLGGDAADRIRQCEAEVCTRLFVDLSRRRDRRWCSMSSCGNRAKVAEFRRRARKG